MKKREMLQMHQLTELEGIINNKESSPKEVRRAQAIKRQLSLAISDIYL